MKKKPKPEAEVNRRISNREYPERICPQSGKAFIPTDARQKFFNEQYRIDYHNDQRKLKRQEVDDFAKRLIYNDRTLKKISESFNRIGKQQVSEDLLLYEGFDRNVFSYVTTNKETGENIFWSVSYGISCTDIKNKYFKIFKNKKAK
jgi:hypothetical protein